MDYHLALPGRQSEAEILGHPATRLQDVGTFGDAYHDNRLIYGDNLSALAERFYGDWSLWRLIFEATNERAAEDPSFHVIENPRLIRPG